MNYTDRHKYQQAIAKSQIKKQQKEQQKQPSSSLSSIIYQSKPPMAAAFLPELRVATGAMNMQVVQVVDPQGRENKWCCSQLYKQLFN